MAYEYHTKVPFGLKISQLSANAGSGGRFVQKSAGNVRNDLSGPILESPDPAFALNHNCPGKIHAHMDYLGIFEAKISFDQLF